MPRYDDDEDDCPRKRKKKRTSSGVGWPLWVGLGVVLLMVVVGAGLVVRSVLNANNPIAKGDVAGGSGDSGAGSSSTIGGVKYVPRESEKKFEAFMKTRELTTITEAEVFAIMGEPTRKEAPITVNKNGTQITMYKVFWITVERDKTYSSQILFTNGRIGGIILGAEIETPNK